MLSSAGVLAGGLAGCLGRLGGGDGGESGADLPPEGVTGGEHRLYLANRHGGSRRVDLVVTGRETGDAVIDGTYELPAERGAEFAQVATWGRRYDVDVAVTDGPDASFEWHVADCGGSEAPGGSRNAAVRIRPDGGALALVVDQCDAIQAGTTVPFGPAREYAVE